MNVTPNWKRDCAVLVVLWLFMLACTTPFGNFPLNDDWNYATSVRVLLKEHRLIITHWSLAAALPHLLLGWLFTAIGGFSFDTLRAMSMIGGLGTGLIAYFLCLRVGAPSVVALLCAATWLTNPIVFNLSTTFMTDITFMLFAGALLLFLASRLEKFTWLDAAIASLLAVLVCLTRQTGLVIPIAFGIVAMMAKATRRFSAILPFAISVGAVILFQEWLNNTHGMLMSYRVEHEWIRQLLAKGAVYVTSNMMSNLICAFVYIGLFLFPIALFAFPIILRNLEKKERKTALIMFGEPVVLLAVGLLMTHSIMPLGDNVLYDLGIGPVILGGGKEASKIATAPQWFWLLVTIFGVLGAGAIVSVLLLCARRVRENRAYSLLLITFTLYMTVIGFRGFFDRYLIFPFFILLPLIASLVPADIPGRIRVLKPIAALSILLFAVYSVAGTHDYFAWNRARWQAVHDLVDVEKVSPMHVDGGLEFNGWYGYDPQFRDVGGITLSGDMRHGDEYIIATQPLPNYEVLSRYAFQRWLPSGGGEIIVMRKLH